MSQSNRNILLYEICIIIISLLLGFFVPILREYNITILVMVSIVMSMILFGYDKKKYKDTKETIIAISVFIITFFIVYYLFGFLIGFTIPGTNVWKTIMFTLIYISGREFLRHNLLMKINNRNLLLILSIIMFIILDLSNQTSRIIGNTDYHPLIIYCSILLPIISNNIVLTYLSKKSGYIPGIIYAGIMSIYRYVIPILPNTNMSSTTAIDTIVPILLWVRMNTHFEQKEKKQNTINDNIINLSILVFPVVLMMIILYFTSGYFRYESIVIGTTNMEPTINKGDIIIVDKRNNNNIKIGDTIAYKKGNVIMISKVNEIDGSNNQILYYIQDDEKITEPEIIGIVTLRIKYLGWPSVWSREKNKP